MASVIGDLFVRLGVDFQSMDRDLRSAEARLEKFGTQMFFLGSRVTAGVTIPMTAAAVAVSKFGLDFDKAMTESLAIMQGATPEIREELESVAKAVSESTKFSASEAAEGFRHLISAGIETAEELSGALPIAAKFAQAGLMDLAKSAEYLSGAQAAMGYKTEDATQNLENMTRVADVLTAANNKALGTVEDYAAALSNKAGAALRLMGKDVEEGVAVLMAFAEQNVKGKLAGQQLMMVMRDLSTHALKSSDAFKKHGISVFDSMGRMKNMATIIQSVEKATEKMTHAQMAQMFIELGIPQRSINATKALLGYSDAIRQNEAFLKGMGGTTETVADKQMQALWNQIMRLTHAFQNQTIAIFDSFVPVFKDYVIPLAEGALGAFRSLAAGIASLPAPVKALMLAVGGVVALIGPLVAMVGSFALLGSAALRGVTALTGGLGGLFTSMGLAAGGTTALSMTATQMAAAQTTAAKAAIAAALAMGQNAFQANAAGAKMLALTKAQQQAAIAAGTLVVNTGQVTGVMTGLGMMISNVVSKGAALLAWGVRIAAKFAVITAAIELLRPAVEQLFSGWGSSTDSAGEKTSDFGKAVTGVGKVFGFFNDVVTVAGGGLASLVEFLQNEYSYAMEGQRNAMMNAAREQQNLTSKMTENGTVVPHVVDDMNLLSEKAETLAEKWNILAVAWEKLVLEMENRKLPTMDAMADEMRAIIQKNAKEMNKGKGVWASLIPEVNVNTKHDPRWMLADDPFAQYAKLFGPDADDDDYDNPNKKKTRATKEETAAQNLKDALLGVNREAIALKAAWDALTPAQQKNIDVQHNLWAAYSKVRTEVGGNIPLFNDLLANQIEQVEVTERINSSTNKWASSLSDAAKIFQDHSAEILVSQLGMTGDQLAHSWKQHEGAIQELLPLYGRLEKGVQLNIDRYLAWKAALPPGKEFTDAARTAMESMKKLSEDVMAKNKDLALDIEQFTMTVGDRQRRQTRNKLEEITKDHKQAYEARLKDSVYFSGMAHVAYVVHLHALKKAQEDHVKNVALMEDLRYAASIGVNRKILIKMKEMTDEERNELIKRREQWNAFFEDVNKGIENFKMFGEILGALGFEEAADNIAKIGAAMSDLSTGAARFAAGDYIGGTLQMIKGGINFIKSIHDSGWFSNPSWEKMQDTIKNAWDVKVTKEMAKKIDADAKMLGGRVNAMLMHLTEIAAATEPITGRNVGMWASRLAETFGQLARGQMSAAQAARTLDTNFGSLLEVGTATSGMVNRQITELVRLERQYKTGSKAIQEFVDAQLGMAAGGFNKMVAGSFGVLTGLLGEAEDADAALEKQNGLFDKRAKLEAQIADYEAKGVSNEKQRVALMLARNNLLRVNFDIQRQQEKQAAADAAISQLMGPEGQERFDRMGRLASVMFEAAIASGKGLFEVIEMMGPGLDTLAAAQKSFGFESNEAFSKLMKFREFAAMNPELVAMISGLSEYMVGLSNLGFITAGAFMDLGAVITETFDDLVAKGLSGEEAMQAMHKPLQRLWEMQRLFGHAVDETTQALLDEAEASGAVGIKFMSANDRMVLGIETLINRFEIFLRHLGINLPTAAEGAASSVEQSFNNIRVRPIDIRYRYTQEGPDPDWNPEMHVQPVYYDQPDPTTFLAEGGVLNKPTFVAGEDGAEVVMPLDRLFAEIEAMNRAEYASSEKAVAKLYMDGRLVAQAVIPHVQGELRRLGLIQ